MTEKQQWQSWTGTAWMLRRYVCVGQIIKYLLHLFRIIWVYTSIQLTLTWSKRRQFVTHSYNLCAKATGGLPLVRPMNWTTHLSKISKLRCYPENISSNVFVKMTNKTISISEKIQFQLMLKSIWSKEKLSWHRSKIANICMQICAFVSIRMLRRFPWFCAMENRWLSLPLSV